MFERSPEILGNFPNICIKTIKTIKNNGENVRKMQNFNENFQFLLAVGKMIIVIYLSSVRTNFSEGTEVDLGMA